MFNDDTEGIYDSKIKGPLILENGNMIRLVGRLQLKMKPPAKAKNRKVACKRSRNKRSSHHDEIHGDR